MAEQKQGGIQHFTVQEAHNVNLGQGGSVFLEANGTTFTPDVGVVIAITALSDCRFDTLTAEDAKKYWGVATAGWESKGDTFDANADQIPEGVTIYGRWTSVQVGSTGTNKCICYMGS